MKLLKMSAMLSVCLWLLLIDHGRLKAEVDQTQIPEYVSSGLSVYKMKGYILFTSLKRENKWVLADIHLDRMQRFGTQ